MATNEMATALLTEHFRYTPLVSIPEGLRETFTNTRDQTLLDEIINMVNELVFLATNAVETGLNNAPLESLGFKPDSASPMSEDARREALQETKQMEVDNGIVQLETLLNSTVDKTFDKFEIYTLRNILSVGHEEEELAPWVRLEHYKNLELTTAADAPTPEQVQLQRRKLHETTKLNTMLKAEEAKNQAVLSRLHSLLGDGQGKTGTGPTSTLR